MKAGNLYNQRTGEIIGKQVWKADSFWARFRGLLGRSHLDQGEGLWLIPCQQVHMWGMKFPISVWYLDSLGKVCELIDDLPPGKVSPRVGRAVSILEFSKDWARRTDTRIGDQLIWQDS